VTEGLFGECHKQTDLVEEAKKKAAEEQQVTKHQSSGRWKGGTFAGRGRQD
jgi:hypothetical protein